MPSNHLILCHPLLLPPSIFPSIRIFSKESVLHIRWPKCWTFSFSISPSNEHSGLISFRIDWLDLLAAKRFKINLIFSSHNHWDIQKNKLRAKFLGKHPKLCSKTGLIRKLLYLSLSPNPKCQNPTATNTNARSPAGTQPYTTTSPRATLSAAAYAQHRARFTHGSLPIHSFTSVPPTGEWHLSSGRGYKFEFYFWPREDGAIMWTFLQMQKWCSVYNDQTWIGHMLITTGFKWKHWKFSLFSPTSSKPFFVN